MVDDPIVVEVRRIREELARKYDFDVAAIFGDLRERQKAVGNRLVRLGAGRVAEKSAASYARKNVRR